MEKPLHLPPALWLALDRMARDEDVTVGQVIRDAIDRDLRRRAAAKTAVRPDERLVAPLRALLADDFAFARGWEELQSRLVAKGYHLAESGGGLILQAHESGRKVCKASELGYSYSTLLRRFDCTFPGHSHSAPLRRIRGY